MCRAISEEENRRCGCDTSEDRRLRRRNGAVRAKYADLVSKVLPIKVSQPSIPTARYTPEDVEFIVKGQLSSMRESEQALVEKVELGISGVYLVERENAIRQIGEGVEFIAEKRYGAPTDDDFIEVSNTFVDKSLQFQKVERKIARQAGMSRSEAKSHAIDLSIAKFEPLYVEETDELLDRRNIANKQALEDVGVVFATSESIEFTADSDDVAVKSLQNAITFYPQTWIDASNANHAKIPLQVKHVEGRASYTHEFEPEGEVGGIVSKLTVAREEWTFMRHDSGMKSAIHEFAHRVEMTVPGINQDEEVFLMRRAGHINTEDSPNKPERLKSIDPEKDNPEEFGFKDHFPDHYMGRVYRDNPSREILSMGMETLFTGSNGAFAGISDYREDADYKCFILGLLASSARPSSRN